MIVASDPKRYFVPPHVGKNGWIDLIVESYQVTAPKRLVAQIAG